MLDIKTSSKAIKKTKFNKKNEQKKVVKLKKISKHVLTKNIKAETTKNGADILGTKDVIADASKIKKKINYILPSQYITDNLVSSCLTALEKLAASYENKNVLFGNEIPIFMEIRSIKIQNSYSKHNNIKFVLPHSTVASSGEVCLITPDLKKGKKIDHEPSIEHWEDILRNAGVTSVKTVLPMRQLRVEYDQYELKRKLLTLHDFIMVDNRVLNHVSHLLGKIFFKKHNMLIPVKINEKGNIKNDIDVGLRTVMLRLSEGQTSTILVGHTGMQQNEIKENILALVEKINKRFPGGEENVRSLSIKLPLSLSLPLYITLRSSNSIANPKVKRNKPKEFVECEGELTTKPGRIVRVAPDGTVHLKKQSKKKKVNDTSELEDMDDTEEE